jgi:hypothetical protein
VYSDPDPHRGKNLDPYKDKDMLEKVQEKAVKMVASLKGEDYLEKCAKLGLVTLEKRMKDQDMALV